MTQSPSGRPRSVQTVRGLLLSLAVLVLLVLMVAGLAGQCSLHPGGPDTRGAVVPTVDAEAELRRLARAVAFPVRVPQLPAQWRATSADVDRVGQAPDSPATVRVGWLPSEGTYLRLTQSSVAPDDLVSFDTGTRSAATGMVRVQDENWAVYPGPHGEQIWVADLGAVRILITGSAGEPEFRTLATATLAAPVAAR
ncbi:MAG: DUF4245 domain-containing protein [Pseudonocardiaceae bacterium]